MTLTNTIRKTIVPAIERYDRLAGWDIMAVKRAQDISYAGVVPDAEIDDVVGDLVARDRTYPRLLAALKYREPDGVRVYERASWAYVPNGRGGKYQYHVRLFPHEKGVAVWAHYELNPWHSPVRHYRGHEWDSHEGIEWARNELGVDPSYDRDGVVPVTRRPNTE